MPQSNQWVAIYYSRASGDIFFSKKTAPRARDIQSTLKKAHFQQASEFIFYSPQYIVKVCPLEESHRKGCPF